MSVSRWFVPISVLLSLSASAATLQLSGGETVTLSPNTTTTVSCSGQGGVGSSVECAVDTDCGPHLRCNTVGRCIAIDPCDKGLKAVEEDFNGCRNSGHTSGYCFDEVYAKAKAAWGSCDRWSDTCNRICDSNAVWNCSSGCR